MPRSCCAVGCTNRHQKDSNVKYYRIPSGKSPFELNRRQLWLQAIKRENWKENEIKNATLCSQHFISGERSNDPASPDFVPSLFAYTNSSDKGEEKIQRFKRHAKRESYPAGKLAKMDDIPVEKASSSTAVRVEDDETSLLHLDICNLKKEIEKLKKQNEMLNNSADMVKFSFRSIKSDLKRIKFFTGLDNCEVFMWVLQICKQHISTVSSSLSWEDHLLIVLMKIRLGSLNLDLATRFSIPVAYVSSIYKMWIPVLSSVMSNLVVWPSRLAARQHLPECFKIKFHNCRCIIDCTEIFIERPSNLTARSQTWSNYKHHNTVKFLIGITPTGSICFLSKGAGGRMSDKEITIQSGFIEKLERGDQILADRGFLISHEVATVGAHLIMPSFTKNKKQLSKREVDSSRQIARARIHVERVIGKLKQNRILQSIIPISMIKQLDDIMMIAAGITNLHKSIVPL